jgi:hypothetical protein
MTEEFYTRETYKPDHTKYGGKIYLSDFDTDYKGKNNKGSEIAKRIIADCGFDIQCAKDAQARDRRKKYLKGCE